MKFSQGQRKTVLFLAVLLVSALLVALTERLSGEQFVGIVNVAFPLVVVGNVAEHLAKRGQPQPS